MRVAYFYAKEEDRAVKALPAYAEKVYTGEDDLHYWRELKARWNGKDTLVVIEQDIIVRPEVFQGFRKCPHPWCSYGYWRVEMPPHSPSIFYAGLGCTKFSAQFMEAMPFPEETVWLHLDGALRRDIAVQTTGYVWPHVHGIVEHWGSGAGGGQAR